MANKLDGAIPRKDMAGDKASPFACKCQTLGQIVLGDGCDICNPELAKELEEDREELIPAVDLEDPNLSVSVGSLISQWEELSASWTKLADERMPDVDLADRAAARAGIYIDCANDLRNLLSSNAEREQREGDC